MQMIINNKVCCNSVNRLEMIFMDQSGLIFHLMQPLETKKIKTKLEALLCGFKRSGYNARV